MTHRLCRYQQVHWQTQGHHTILFFCMLNTTSLYWTIAVRRAHGCIPWTQSLVSNHGYNTSMGKSNHRRRSITLRFFDQCLLIKKKNENTFTTGTCYFRVLNNLIFHYQYPRSKTFQLVSTNWIHSSKQNHWWKSSKFNHFILCLILLWLVELMKGSIKTLPVCNIKIIYNI